MNGVLRLWLMLAMAAVGCSITAYSGTLVRCIDPDGHASLQFSLYDGHCMDKCCPLESGHAEPGSQPALDARDGGASLVAFELTCTDTTILNGDDRLHGQQPQLIAPSAQALPIRNPAGWLLARLVRSCASFEPRGCGPPLSARRLAILRI